MGAIQSILIILLLTLSSACSELAVFVMPGVQSFAITNDANLVSSDSYTLDWAEVSKAKGYDILIAKDSTCSDVIFEKSNISKNQITLDSLNDGQYYVCVFALIGQQKMPAKNNGIMFVVDRTDPIVIIPPLITTERGEFNPQIAVSDMTEVIVGWQVISGPGTITFDNSNSMAPKIRADKNGIYVLKALVTDQAGHRVEQLYQFFWEGSTSATPVVATLAHDGAALDGFVNLAEKSSVVPLWTLFQTGASVITYTSAFDDTASPNCDASLIYNKSTVARAIDLTTDGIYAVCAKLEDSVGTLSYLKSDTIVRDTIAPVFVSLANTNAAADGIINISEIALNSALWALTATGQTKTDFSAALDDSSSSLICDSSILYNRMQIANPLTLTVDGTYASCVKLSDEAGNATYGKSSAVVRDTSIPVLTSFVLTAAASDGYINDAESSGTTALWTLAQSGSSQIKFTVPLENAAANLLCDASQTYGQTAISRAADIATDGTWALCVRLTNSSGNVIYGTSPSLIRDTLHPTFTSLSGANAASDGYVSDSEKASSLALWSLTGSGYATADYSIAASDTASALTCDGTVNYQLSAVPIASSLSADGPYAACVRLVDAAGNITFGKSSQIVRDTTGPTLTAFALANDAADGYINASEVGSTLPLWALTQSGASTVSYTLALSDTAGALVCDASKTYGQTTIAQAVSLTTDGSYAACVKLVDSIGNTTYGKSQQVARGASGPIFGSLTPATEASDGFVSNTERLSTSPIWTLAQSGATSFAYTIPLDDSGTAVVCDASQTYNQSAIAHIDALTVDGIWTICAKITDVSTNIAYGKANSVVRDTVGPSFTSLALANAASDGFINDTEKALTTAMWTLNAGSYASAAYSSIYGDAAGTLVCDASKSYGNASIATPSDVASDMTFVLCVKLTDAAGNITFGKSQAAVRDTALPTITTFATVGTTSDGYINNSEKTTNAAMYTFSGSGQTSTLYSSPLDDSTPVVCDGTISYGNGTIPLVSALTVDGAYTVCVVLSDSAGNKTYGRAPQVVRKTSAASFTSLALANDASDGFISNDEKNLSTPMWALTANGQTTTAYSSPTADAANSLVCDSGLSYGQSSIATPAALSTDNTFVICVKLTDAAGNIAYGKSSPVVRDTALPTFTSLALANAAIDGYINDSEKLTVASMWTLAAAGYSAVTYTAALSDSPTALVCDSTQSYAQSSIAGPSSLSADGSFALCARLVDTAGNVAYGKSAQVIRDIVFPVFTSLARSNEAADGFINNAEKSSTSALYTLTSSGQITTTSFTSALDDSTPVTCDSGKTYGSSSVPLISSLTTDGTYAVCVVLTDAAGNKTFGKSAQVVRSTAGPTFTSLALANAAVDGYINDSEKLATTALWTLSATGYSSVAYTVASNDVTGSLTCDSSNSYGQSTIALASSLSSDITYSMCAKFTDAAGNVAYGKAAQVIRDTQYPVLTSLLVANQAADGYVNNSEKSSTSAIYALIASGQTQTSYTVVLDDSTGSVTCDVGKSYSATVPLISSMTTDGTWVVCVRLSDAAGNSTYGRSQQVVRDIVAPTITATALTTTDLTPPLAGTINDSTATLSVSVNNRTYTPTRTGTAWNIADNVLPMTGANTYNVVATATDPAGNVGTDATSNELTINAPTFVSSWKTDNPGTSSSTSIKLPLRATGTYNFVVQWGDGTDSIITAYNSPSITHDYGAAGTYTVTITNVIIGWAFQNTGDKEKITNISKWGPFTFGNDGAYFDNAKNMTITATDIPSTAGTTNFQWAFSGCLAITTIPNIGLWNMSAVTDISGMFYWAQNFNSSVNSWDTGSLQYASRAFEGTTSYTQDMNSWNTVNLHETKWMFKDAWLFNGNITAWNTIGLYNMEAMFENAVSFNQPIGVWNTSNVWNMWWVFQRAASFNQPIGTWNTANVVTMGRMFDGATVFNQPLNTWNTSKVTNMEYMFSNARAFNQDLSSWNTALVQNLSSTFGGATAFNGNITTWNTSSVKWMNSTFAYTEAFNQAIGNWNTANVLEMQYTFSNARAFNQPLNTWNVSQVYNFAGMFNFAVYNQSLASWNTLNANNMSEMFKRSSFVQPLSSWNVSNVQNFSSMFLEHSTFNQPLNSWVTSAATNMASMFERATVFNQPLASWDVSKVTIMTSMFRQTAFNQDISSWNVGLVTMFNNMFDGAQSFNQPIGTWTVSNATTMSAMFWQALAFNQDISSWNVGKVTSMFEMFRLAGSFNQNITGWNVTKVTNMNSMFRGATAFNQNIGLWSPLLVTDMASMLQTTGLSQTNYSAILDGWGSKALLNNISLGAGSTKYLAAGVTGRANLIAKGWIITDGGLGP